MKFLAALFFVALIQTPIIPPSGDSSTTIQADGKGSITFTVPTPLFQTPPDPFLRGLTCQDGTTPNEWGECCKWYGDTLLCEKAL